MLAGNVSQFARIFLCLELGVTVANGFFIQPFTSLQRVDVGSDVFTLVDEFGIGLDQTNELITIYFLLLWCERGITCDQTHDVVIVNHGRSEQDKLKIKLLHRWICLTTRLVLLGLEPLCSIQIHTLETQQLILGQHMFYRLSVVIRQVGVLIQLGFESLHVLEQSDELAACNIAFEIGNFFRSIG